MNIRRIHDLPWLAAATVLILQGCSAVPLQPAAAHVRLMNQEPTGCEYLGEVTGEQGGAFSGPWTSNANLETGARNDMKNSAATMGADTVVVLSTRAGNTGNWGQGSGHSEQTNVVYSGTAWRCQPH
ncbi:MAG: hypothetical protein RIQ52_667 [Pseudomonadota bacterium]|jgi:uncharacterized protein YbjQ (UPF0145 family)